MITTIPTIIMVMITTRTIIPRGITMLKITSTETPAGVVTTTATIITAIIIPTATSTTKRGH